MTAHGLRAALPEVAPSAPRNPARHPLSELDPQHLSKRLVVFTPNGREVHALLERGREFVPQLTTTEIVVRAISHNPDTFWAIARRDRFNAMHPSGEGFVAFLMLREAGLRGLIDGSFNAKDPDLTMVAPQNERPAGIYVWAVHARGIIAGGMPLAVEKITSSLYQGVDLYARPVTAHGYRITEAMGFRRGASYRGANSSQLWTYRRSPTQPSERPVYDGDPQHCARNELSVNVARSMEDFARVLNVRGAVYVAEQLCPYDEEFDGNDFCATHLLGYVGKEPAGCLRIRYFAGFAKIERLAVRREFRGLGLGSQLVKAAIELCRMKGYQRLCAHAQKRLVSFWSDLGFQIPEKSRELVFSDFDYVEMLHEAGRHPQPISIETDPYIVIRPEGRWHVPGILERSSARSVTRPSIEG